MKTRMITLSVLLSAAHSFASEKPLLLESPLAAHHDSAAPVQTPEMYAKVIQSQISNLWKEAEAMDPEQSLREQKSPNFEPVHAKIALLLEINSLLDDLYALASDHHLDVSAYKDQLPKGIDTQIHQLRKLFG